MFKVAEQHLEKTDPIIAKLIKQYSPCTLASEQDYFWALCSSIISQQLSTKAADTIASRFRALYEGLPFNASTVLDTPLEKLTSVGISRAKASYIKDLAEKFPTINKDFSILSDKEIVEHLVTVKGIGCWTAEMFLIFSLNRLDILPTGDLGVKRAVQIQYQLDDLPTPKQLLDIGKAWQPYRTIASWYLWRSLNNK